MLSLHVTCCNAASWFIDELCLVQGSWTRPFEETWEGLGGDKYSPSQRNTDHAGWLQQGPGGPQRQDICSANTVSRTNSWASLFFKLLSHPVHAVSCVCVQVGGDRGEVKKQRKPARGPAHHSRAQRDGHRKRGSGQEAGGECSRLWKEQRSQKSGFLLKSDFLFFKLRSQILLADIVTVTGRFNHPEPAL